MFDTRWPELREGQWVEAHFWLEGSSKPSGVADDGQISDIRGQQLSVRFEHVGMQTVPRDWVVAVLPVTVVATTTLQADPAGKLWAWDAPSQGDSVAKAVEQKLDPDVAQTALSDAPGRSSPPAAAAGQHPKGIVAPALPVLQRDIVTVFCVTFMLAHGVELSLVRTQLENGAGIFSCDEYTVLSDSKTWLTPGPPVRLDTQPLRGYMAGRSADNLEAMWQQILRVERFKYHHWTVKVSPDAVFFPDRLRKHVRDLAPLQDPGLLLTPRECAGTSDVQSSHVVQVVSRSALLTYRGGAHTCQEHMDFSQGVKRRDYMDGCLVFLGVSRSTVPELLEDAGCEPGGPTAACNASAGAVVYHPFRTPEAYFQCWQSQQHHPRWVQRAREAMLRPGQHTLQ